MDEPLLVGVYMLPHPFFLLCLSGLPAVQSEILHQSCFVVRADLLSALPFNDVSLTRKAGFP